MPKRYADVKITLILHDLTGDRDLSLIYDNLGRALRMICNPDRDDPGVTGYEIHRPTWLRPTPGRDTHS